MADDPNKDDLDKRIADAKASHMQRSKVDHAAEGRAETVGWAVGIEFVGAVIVSAVIGLLLDKWLNTAPWIMIVLLLLGFGAGLRRAIATSKDFDTDFSTKAE